MEELRSETDMVQYLGKELVSCMKCHLCNTVCPVCDPRVSQGPYGMNRSIYYALKWESFNEHLRDIVYSCSTCGKCVEKCKAVSRALPLIDIIETARELLLVEKMQGPMPEQTNVLKNMHVRGNPWGYPSHERTQWAQDLDIPLTSEAHDMEVLYFVGCASSYDPQAQKIAKNLSRILKAANVKFGISKEEVCSGSEARRMGEPGLFQYLSEINSNIFDETGNKPIITGDPHSYYTFTREYPGKDHLEIYHYTQFLNTLLDKEQLKLSSRIEKRVTYHDPCYLGRRGGIFDEPRRLIDRIPGIDLVEMEHHHEDSDCCGMGGGRMWMEPPEGFLPSQMISKRRVEQAIATTSEILLTACPFCNISLNDAVKDLGKEDDLKVMDITELIIMAL